jgi:hypothetical protein
MKNNVLQFLTPALIWMGILLVPSTCGAQGVGINPTGAAPDPSALLDLNSNASPFMGTLLTRLTTAQRDQIVSPAQSLLIYNTTTKCVEFWENQFWQPLSCTPCPIGGAIDAGIAFLNANNKCYIAATSNQSAGAIWGSSSLVGAGAQGTAVGTGQSNTAAIVSAGAATPGSAARICEDLVSGGFSDWYLPSKDELGQMYLQNGALGMSNLNYWSSSEIDASYAWTYWFQTGLPYFLYTKATAYPVRCIRSY